jgi:hypothetical protein
VKRCEADGVQFRVSRLQPEVDFVFVGANASASIRSRPARLEAPSPR